MPVSASGFVGEETTVDWPRGQLWLDGWVVFCLTFLLFAPRLRVVVPATCIGASLALNGYGRVHLPIIHMWHAVSDATDAHLKHDHVSGSPRRTAGPSVSGAVKGRRNLAVQTECRSSEREPIIPKGCANLLRRTYQYSHLLIHRTLAALRVLLERPIHVGKEPVVPVLAPNFQAVSRHPLSR
ncbi:hypothetical protein AURDEDRAFT_134972 [Auricularia subglabra TFB-10046 SS5]|nr:hypothetical protein AURDEDRAFT_134972 [Auricularia subglabra TFB-10046 SS5]